MGRPLNKKYFGNRNIGVGGYQTTNYNAPGGDDKIGGEGFAGATFSAAVLNVSYGTGKYLDRIPTAVTIGAPKIPGGVQAVAHVSNVKAVAALPNNKGTGYQIGDIIVGTTGTGTKAKFRVTKLRVLNVVISNQAASANFDGGENLVWDSLVDDNWTSPTILRNVVSTGTPNYDLGAGDHPYLGTATYGVWDGYIGGGEALAPASLTITGWNGSTGNTRGANVPNGTGGTGPDSNGYGGTATFTYGIEEVEVVAGYEGDYTAVDVNAQAVTNQGGTGSNATLDIFYGIKTIAVTQKGSGYIGTETVTFAATTDGSEVRATGTIALTTDSGAISTFANQENAIIAYGWSGSAPEIVDIIKQVSGRRYRIKGAGAGITRSAVLVAHAVDAPNEVTITAYDSDNNEYWVTKLTAHLARVTRKSAGAGQFASGTSVQWTFGSAQEDYSVKLQNA